MNRDPATGRRIAGSRTSLILMLVEVIVPLALFYILRAVGVGQWAALLISGAAPLLALAYRWIAYRRIEMSSIFTLSILVAGTLIGLLTGDPRLLVARESYLTGIVGLWMIGTLWAARPFILVATMPLLPPATAATWDANWRQETVFRKVMRAMTLAWGCAFLVDAVARIVMAYTLPLDIVPLAGTALLVLLLIAVVQFSKAYGRRAASAPTRRVGGAR
ncbi:VC0807 family protein [Arthrobacter sp.]|uniref:VC0807 family protein n=1 Tax=Arthrobacter sp. TaxID=1667 RepID=UPI003A9572E9